MSLVRGALLAGRFRTQHELDGISNDDQRNILIVEMGGHTNQPRSHFQAMNDSTLAGAAAVYIFLRDARIRTEQQLKAISDDDQRNILIVELGAQTGLGASLQGLNNIELLLLGLGKSLPGDLRQGSFLRGVLLAGQFRTQRELSGMSNDDQRNTLIVEMAGRTNQPRGHFQAMDDFTLSGAGAVYVFLRNARIRTEQQLKAISDDDQRNILIVELGAQTGLGSKLQGLRNLDLVRLGLGVDQAEVFKPLPGPLQQPATSFVFSVESLEVQAQKADSDHSDSDWLSFIVTISNTGTKSARTFSAGNIHLEGSIKTGDIIRGPFVSDPIDAQDSDIVTISYVITNLGSSDAEEQFAQAIKVTNKIVGIVAPIVGAAIGLIFSANLKGGLEYGQEIAKGFDSVISTLGDVFDFLDIHFAPPNCNGEVLHDTLIFLPNELAQAVGGLASREYTGPQQNDRCGSPPKSKLNFVIRRVPST